MNDSINLYKDLPPREMSFQIEVIGDITKKRYVGDFTTKIPNAKDQCFIAKHQAFLNGNFADFLDIATLDYHKMVAYLRYTLTEYPKFWKQSDLGYELIDMNVVKEVYNQVITEEKNWLKEVWGDEYEDRFEGTEETSEEGGSATPTEG